MSVVAMIILLTMLSQTYVQPPNLKISVGYEFEIYHLDSAIRRLRNVKMSGVGKLLAELYLGRGDEAQDLAFENLYPLDGPRNRGVVDDKVNNFLNRPTKTKRLQRGSEKLGVAPSGVVSSFAEESQFLNLPNRKKRLVVRRGRISGGVVWSDVSPSGDDQGSSSEVIPSETGGKAVPSEAGGPPAFPTMLGMQRKHHPSASSFLSTADSNGALEPSIQTVSCAARAHDIKFDRQIARVRCPANCKRVIPGIVSTSIIWVIPGIVSTLSCNDHLSRISASKTTLISRSADQHTR